MKKLLSFMLVGLFTAVGSFASANCLDNGLSSDSDLTDISSNANSMGTILMYPKNGTLNGYVCVIQDVEGNTVNGASNITYYNNNKVVCSDSVVNSFMYEFTNPINSYSIYSSSSPIIYVSSCSSAGGSDSDSLLNPGVISSGLQSGVSAFLSGFGGLIPMILMLGLPIIILTIFWNRIRSYIKHIFVVDKPRGDDIANCNLTLNKYGQFEHHVIGQYDHGDYVDIPGVGLVGKDELPYYLDENLEFNYKQYKQDHTTFDNRDPGIPGDDYYKRSEDIEEQSRIYEKYL